VRHAWGIARQESYEEAAAGLHVSMQTFLLLLVWLGSEVTRARHGHGMAGVAGSGSNAWAVSDWF
jgi:hypothetical protein